jgi:spore germination protein GerM
VIDDLINGPLGDLTPTLPETAMYRGVTVVSDLLTIDFGKELQDGLAVGSNAEMAAVYSIVNTLALNFPQIKRISFLVEGKPVGTLKGHLDLREPLFPDYSLEWKGSKPAGDLVPQRREP